MKKCPSCGKTTEDDSLDFCPSCGAYYVTRPAGHPVPDTSSLPEDPFERGTVLLDAGRFAEGVGCLKEAVSDGRVVDDATYNRIVDSITGCMLGISLQPGSYNDAGMIGLSLLMPDRDPLLDIMGKLAGSLGVCSIQNGVLGLANSYVYLFMDTFRYYTDMRQVMDICRRAASDLGDMVDRAIGLMDAYPAKGPGPLEWLSCYHTFAEKVLDTVSDIVDSTPAERLDALREAWARSSRPVYASAVGNALTLHTHSVAAGKLSSKVLSRSSAAQLRAFAKMYLAGPKK